LVASYHEIIPSERIVDVHDMHIDGRLISVSLAIVEMRLQGRNTELCIPEQGVFSIARAGMNGAEGFG
jgi:hypothetical protein